MIGTDFYSQQSELKKEVERRFPTVTDFDFWHHGRNVTPVEYFDEKFNKRYEHPPVANWKIGDKRFKYVFKPRFIQIPYNTWFRYGYTVKPDYDHERKTLLDIIEMTVNGMDDRQINEFLGNYGYQRPERERNFFG